jgi:hypothetical protein
VTDRFVIALARVAGPRLRVLRLSQCTQVGDASMAALQVHQWFTEMQSNHQHSNHSNHSQSM